MDGPAGYMLGPASYMVVAHVIIVSAPVQIIGFWFFFTWSEVRVMIWGLFGQGIGDLDLGLTILLLLVHELLLASCCFRLKCIKIQSSWRKRSEIIKN